MCTGLYMQSFVRFINLVIISYVAMALPKISGSFNGFRDEIAEECVSALAARCLLSGFDPWLKLQPRV